MIKLLASDVDGTIVYNDNKISQKNIEAIEKLNKTDVIFTICTGKTYLLMKELCKKINATYGIFGNGTQIINLKIGKEVERNALKKEELEKCIDVANKNNLHIHIYTDNKIIVQGNLKYIAYRNYVLYKDSVNFQIVEDIEQYIEENEPNVLKLIISGERDLTKIKQELINKLSKLQKIDLGIPLDYSARLISIFGKISNKTEFLIHFWSYTIEISDTTIKINKYRKWILSRNTGRLCRLWSMYRIMSCRQCI